MLYGTFLGAGSSEGSAIAVDGVSNAYVTGYTYSTSFPTTPGAFDMSHNGGWDGFVTKLSASGSVLAYSTFLGSGSDDYGYSIAVDGVGSAYVTGDTWSVDFPTTPGAFDTSHNGGWPAFVAKVAVGGAVCPDLDDSGDVDVADIQAAASRWRRRSGDPGWDPRFDLDGDGDVDMVDVMRVAAEWQRVCS